MAQSPDPFDWLPGALTGLEQEGLLRTRRVRSGLQSGADGSQGGIVDFGSNDYLGLANDPRLAEAAANACRDHAWGSGASPVVSGRTEWHAELERQLADFEQAEAAMLFPSGYAANSGVIPALVGERDAILADAKNHASLIDGCRLSRAERFIYRHNDADHLGELLKKAGGYRRQLIVTDGLFSMDGDFAPLVEISELAERHGAMLLVDEAHATGVWGDHGRGSVEHFGVDHSATLRVGTLSKALGSIGGFVVGDQRLIDWLYNRARPYVFSTAPPAAIAAAGLAALQIVRQEPERRQRVVSLAEGLRARLQARGWSTGDSTSQIVPIRVGGPEAAVALSQRLAKLGVFAPAIRPPSVPEGESLLRISLSCAHSEEDLERLLEGLGEADQASSTV